MEDKYFLHWKQQNDLKEVEIRAVSHEDHWRAGLKIGILVGIVELKKTKGLEKELEGVIKNLEDSLRKVAETSAP